MIKYFSFAAMIRCIVVLAMCIFFVSCRPETYVPKPRGYYHVQFPERSYRSFNDPGFPYRFEYPAYANIIKDTLFFGQKAENPYWINIDFPSLGGKVYISYKTISTGSNMQKLMDDNYEMTYYHTKKADYIEDMIFNIDSTKVYGMMYNVTGNAASAYQFYATDSVKHFIRGALYFDVTPNADSLKPVNDFLRTDIEHMLQTLRWN
jgi:gliding motility-associated lipoprotein GldD